MKRKTLFLILIIAIVIIGYLYVRPVKPVLSMSKAYDVVPGQTVQIDVIITNSPGVASSNLNLTWDPYYITLTNGTPPFPGGPPLEVREGPLIVARNTTTFLFFLIVDLENGQLYVTDIFTNTNPQEFASGDGVICTLNFTMLRTGASTIHFNPAGGNETGSVIGDANNLIMSHDESDGLITSAGPPPVWDSTGFQTMLIYSEVGVLGVASVIIYVYAHPRPPKEIRRKQEFEPIIDPEDQT